MKQTFLAIAATALAVATPAAANAATIVNAGFETGDTTGWSSNNASFVSVVTSALALGSGAFTYLPPEGQYFAKLVAPSVANTSTTLFQQFEMTAGDVVSFMVAFDAADYLPYDDAGGLTVFDFTNLAGTTLFSKSVSDVGDFSETPWTYVSFTAPTTGTYQVSAKVQNVGDGALSSAVYLDLATSAVPEPATWAMLLVGFGVVGLSMRRRQSVRVSFA